MRIIAGRFRGTALAAVGAGDAAAHLRPTSDRVRESLFNLILHAPLGDIPDIEGARVLDLFAGTGALGLEALSRGATHATFLDTGAKSLDLLRRNIARLRIEDETRVLARDATRPGPNTEAPHDLVFLDPPYGKGMGERALTAAIAGGWIAPGALIVWEENTTPAPPPGLTPLDTRRYGDTMITLLRADP
jgi:16S rRNA (guanine966-N2)-methyltransferase